MAYAKNGLAALTILLSACGTLTEKPKVSMYEEPANGEFASIEFENSEPFIYENGKPSTNYFSVIKWTAGTFKDKAVKIYSDSNNCVDYQVLDLKKKSNFNIPADQYVTFEYSAFVNSDKVFVWCPNRITFTPEANKKYIVKNTLHVNDIRFATCTAQLFDASEPEKPLPFISRDEHPVFWAPTSPRCEAKDLETVKLVTESRGNFECTVKLGSRSC
jgi:hypothetical protein